jgi:hypothetical protein
VLEGPAAHIVPQGKSATSSRFPTPGARGLPILGKHATVPATRRCAQFCGNQAVIRHLRSAGLAQRDAEYAVALLDDDRSHAAALWQTASTLFPSGSKTNAP